MRKIVGGVVLGLLSLGSLTACEGLNNNLSIKDNGLVGVSKNYNSSNLALNSGKNYDYMITHSLPKGFTFKTENDGTPFSNKTLELIDTKVYILDYANDNYIEDPIQGWTSLEYYLYEDNDIPDVYKQDGFYLMLIAHEGWQDFSFDYNLVEDNFSEDDRYYVENLSYGYFDGLYEETLTLIDPANTQEIYMKDQDFPVVHYHFPSYQIHHRGNQKHPAYPVSSHVYRNKMAQFCLVPSDKELASFYVKVSFSYQVQNYRS